jgi:membrane-bound metal-dependent hydrolase YbcI (DUF457 family)
MSERRNVTATLAVAGVAGLILPAAWRITAKAGYKPALSLFAIVSPLNIVLLWAFALREWPIERRLREADADGAQSA